MLLLLSLDDFLFVNDAPTTEIYTLSLHDALPILRGRARGRRGCADERPGGRHLARRDPVTDIATPAAGVEARSEEHTSELQSRRDLVCRLLLEKKKER